jgi:hypothetical protein
LPATLLVVLLSIGAGLFAGSYTYTMANPTPRHIPAAVVDPQHNGRVDTVVAGFRAALDFGLQTRAYDTPERARHALLQQQVFAVFEAQPRGVALDTASAAGYSVASLLAQTATKVSASTGIPIRTTDVVPLQQGDPRGLTIFYISLAAVIIGFIGSIQLHVHAAKLRFWERLGFTAAYAVVGGFTIAAVVDWGLGALRLRFPESWAILALTMVTSAAVFTMFNSLFGRWAILPTWLVMVIVGNPSSGGAVSWPLLPSLLGRVGRWLPPGASVSAQHTAVYFPHNQHAQPFAVLAAWLVVALTVAWWRLRRRQT